MCVLVEYIDIYGDLPRGLERLRLQCEADVVGVAQLPARGRRAVFFVERLIPRGDGASRRRAHAGRRDRELVGVSSRAEVDEPAERLERRVLSGNGQVVVIVGVVGVDLQRGIIVVMVIVIVARAPAPAADAEPRPDGGARRRRPPPYRNIKTHEAGKLPVRMGMGCRGVGARGVAVRVRVARPKGVGRRGGARHMGGGVHGGEMKRARRWICGYVDM